MFKSDELGDFREHLTSPQQSKEKILNEINLKEENYEEYFFYFHHENYEENSRNQKD